MDVTTPFILGFYMLRTCYYPIKYIFGEEYCYISNFLEIWAAVMGQFHSFFLTMFRYVCLFHDDWLMANRISPKVSSNVRAKTI